MVRFRNPSWSEGAARYVLSNHHLFEVSDSRRALQIVADVEAGVVYTRPRGSFRPNLVPPARSRPLTDRERTVAAAILARSNTGQGLPPADRVARQLAAKLATLSGCVMDFCGEFMECDDHQDMFETEARHWFSSTLRKCTVYSLYCDFGHVAKLMGLKEEGDE